MCPGDDRKPATSYVCNNTLSGILEILVVRDHLLSFLTTEDMKALNLTSKIFHEAVMDSKEFYKRTLVKFCKDNIEQEQKPFSSCKWKHIILDMSQPLVHLSLVGGVLPHAQSLHLRSAKGKTDEDMQNYLNRIFLYVQRLDSLWIDLSIFQNALGCFFVNERIKSLLGSLKSLRFDIPQNCSKIVHSRFILSQRKVRLQMEENLDLLIKVSFKLVRFVFGKVPMLNAKDKTAVCHFVFKVVYDSKHYLQDLELHASCLNLEILKEIGCLKLKRLVLYGINANQTPCVARIIHLYPELDTLVLKLRQELPKSLLVSIGALKDKLKVLHIKAAAFFKDCTISDWNFLQQMSRLEAVRIRKKFGTWYMRNASPHIASLLPDTVNTVELLGFMEIQSNSFNRLHNLTCLNLEDCNYQYTDTLLQQIFINCKKLIVLKLQSFSQFTEYGLSGYQREHFLQNKATQPGERPSLRDLNGLTCLVLGACGNICLECFLYVIQFKFLKFFWLIGNKRISKPFVLQIAKQNPRLECFGLPLSFYRNTEQMCTTRMELLRLSPPLHLININTQHPGTEFGCFDWLPDKSDYDDDEFCFED